LEGGKRREKERVLTLEREGERESACLGEQERVLFLEGK